jgi:RNA polymerase sigma-70 factor (ECF subfamily)
VTGHDPRQVRRAVADAHRREWAFVLAATARVAGDLDLAEECVQDAYLAALDAWTKQGVPGNPGAWLTTAARRRALDAHRRASALRARLPLLVEPEPARPDEFGDGETIQDDRLRLVFTCCHPALALEAQVALTLRLVCGLSTTEIAAAFLVSETTMAARVTRAKKKISAARIAYRVPEATELTDRLHAVLVVVHLVFTTGHTAPVGDRLVRADLVDRSIELARMLRVLMPDEPDVRGLLALLLLTDARRATRVDDAGRVVLLADQDRARWDRAAIDEGVALVVAAMRRTRPGRFTLQAAIAALHAEAPTYQETDWPQVLRLYDVLARVWPSQVVELNRAVALAMVAGPDVALARVDELVADGRLAGYRYLPATRADLLRRMGRDREAAVEYRAAVALSENEAERGFLVGRLAELGVAGWQQTGEHAEAHGGHPDDRPELRAVAAAEPADGAGDHRSGAEAAGRGERGRPERS